MKLYIPMVSWHYEDTVPAEDYPHAYLTEAKAQEIADRHKGPGRTTEVLEVEFDGR